MNASCNGAESIIRKMDYIVGSDFEHMRDQIEAAMELLGIKSDEAAIVDPKYVKFDVSNSRLLCRIGPCRNIPYIACAGAHDKFKFKGYGSVIYELGGIRYAHMTCTINGTFHNYIMTRRGDMWKLIMRHKKHKMLNDRATKPILKDGMLDEIIKFTIGMFSDKRIRTYGVRMNHGIVFTGPPGNGKTLTCKYLKHLCDKHSISYNVLMPNDLLPTVNQNYNVMLDVTSKHGIVFIDDIDISMFTRNSNNSTVACSLLSALDGIIENKGIKIITTNESTKSFDDAFTRPGRIDKMFEFNPPDYELRLRLINSWHDDIEVDAVELAENTEGLSFAEINAIRDNMVYCYLETGRWDVDAAMDAIQNREDCAIGFSNS